MNKRLLADLVESVMQMNEIARGERAPSREFHVDALCVKALRETHMMAGKKRAKRRETFSRYDTADYLRSEEDMVAYLEACLEEGGDDPALLAVALGDIARAHGMADLAAKTGLTREGLYKALSKDGNPSFATVIKVMRALGLALEPKVAV